MRPLTDYERRVLGFFTVRPDAPVQPYWIADWLNNGREAWPFEVTDVRNALYRLERQGLVRRDHARWARRSRGWKVTDLGGTLINE